MTKLIVPGQADANTEPSELEKRVGDDVATTRYSVSFTLDRGAGREQTLDVDDTDVVELEMEDGQKLWVRVDELEEEFGVSLNRDERTEPDGTLRIPMSLPADGKTRGMGQWVIKGLKIIGVDIAGSIGDFVVGKVESKLQPGPGLYQCSAASASTLQTNPAIDKSKPILVFLHGTASSTDGSFGGLWSAGSSAIGDLIDHYDGQVLAYQHYSLSVSPIENALALLQSLLALESTTQGNYPLRLHLVSHSRGGLVGEVLCRGTRDGGVSFDDIDASFFDGEPYARDRSAMAELGKLLDGAGLQVERFLRVGCPARGTTLADGRLDRYLSGIVNIIEKVPGLANPVVDGISSLLLAVVHKRTNPQELPGMEAMMPTSPTIRMLNRPDVTVAADLHVIGGDVKASGFINRLKVIITDLFYREDHDLVVNTPSMFGGATRRQPVRYWIDTGGKVNHFRYFTNSSTSSRLSTGLMHEQAAFHTLDLRPFEITEDHYRKRSLEPQPIVFVLPGVMGSHLSLDDNRIWLDYRKMAFGGVSRLSIDKRAPRVQPVKPMDDVYGELMKHLAATHDVRPFAYDWRISIVESASLLHKQVEEALEEAEAMDQPIRFIAHSMGGLVVRAMLATPEGAELWARIIRHAGSRFIMLGTPNRGSHALAAMLLGRDSLVSKLALLDLKNSYSELLQIISRFDGVLQLMPKEGSLDLFDRQSWMRLHEFDAPDTRGVFNSDVASSRSANISWSVPDQEQLQEAARVSALISSSAIDSARMIYVAGVAPHTAIDITIDEKARQGRRVQVHATSEGDGRVAWSSGIPQELPAHNVYYMDAVHGDMASTTQAFPALQQLLEEGSTHRLSRTKPASRGAGERFMLPQPAPDMYPDRADLLASAMGGRRKVERVPATRCKVRIVHGDLARSRFPVVVGHYQGDTIVSAESYLNLQVEGRLRERHRLGIYPDKKGTSIIMLNWPEDHELNRQQSPVHPGAIVVGLGVVGELTPGALSSTLVDGLMDYALQVRDSVLERSRQRQIDVPSLINAPLTSLLISSGNDLSVRDCLRSILRAVSQVNQRMAPPTIDGSLKDPVGGKPSVRISELDIIEYLEDRAIQATRALVSLAGTDEIDKDFDIHRQVVVGQDGRRRVSFDEDGGWWQRMRITTMDNNDLNFETLTDKARVESQLQSTQRILVDRFLARASASSSSDPSLGKTLFELVMPNQLKQYAPDRRDLILMLDDKAAAYPWELLQDGSDTSGRPMAVESGVVRQLISGKFRLQPLMSQAPSALVIGDPVADEIDASLFPSLPGAAAEARQVAAQLNAAAFDTCELVGIEARPLDVVTALYERPYRIVHIAAHGVFDMPVDDHGRPFAGGEVSSAMNDADVKRVSGVVLGDGIYLTPGEFEQMRNVPELVFINCCHLGNQQEGSRANTVEYHRLAANVATQLIRMGVRAVIAAGWAVDDDAAKLFARVFYERFLAFNTFGDAVAAARQACYELEHRRNGNTWGAYQCYGDPDFALQEATSYGASGPAQTPLSASELKQQLENLARQATYASASDKESVQHQLEALMKVIPDDWYEWGSVCSAIGTTYAEIGKLEQAASFYQRANTSRHSDASIASLEQLVNMKARFAVELSADEKATEECRQRALNELAEAENIVDSLVGINGSQERYAIKGGVHKSMVNLGNKSMQRRQLVKMAEAYNLAHERGIANKQSNLFYPLQNELAALVMIAWYDTEEQPAQKKAIAGKLQTLEQYLTSADLSDADFWSACQKPDMLLLKALSNNKILSPKEVSEIRKAYQSAFQRGSTERQRKSICAHIRFFKHVAEMQLPKSKKETKNLCEALEALADDLTD